MKIKKLIWEEYNGSVNSYFTPFGLIFKIYYRDNIYHATCSKNDKVCVDSKLETLELAKERCQKYFEELILEGIEK